MSQVVSNPVKHIVIFAVARFNSALRPIGTERKYLTTYGLDATYAAMDKIDSDPDLIFISARSVSGFCD